MATSDSFIKQNTSTAATKAENLQHILLNFFTFKPKKPVIKLLNYLSQTLQKTEQALCSPPSSSVSLWHHKGLN